MTLIYHFIYQVRDFNIPKPTKRLRHRFSMCRGTTLDKFESMCCHDHATVVEARCCKDIQQEMIAAFGKKWAPAFPPPSQGLVGGSGAVEISADWPLNVPVFEQLFRNLKAGDTAKDELERVKASMIDQTAASVGNPEPEKATVWQPTVWQRFVKAKQSFESVVRDLFPANGVVHFQLAGHAIERIRELSGLSRDMSADEAAEFAGTLPGPETEPDAAPHAEEPESEEAVDHPAHYNSLGAFCLGCGRPIECIDVIEHMTLNVGNSMKYVWRADHKGARIKDLKKAGWYIQREIQRLEREDLSRVRE